MDRGPDGKAFKRLNAIHLLLLGAPFELSRRNSRVSNRKMSPARVTSDILSVVDYPPLASQTHWTLTKLCGWLREEKQIELSYRTLVRYLHEHRYARHIPRKIPEPPDPDRWIHQREEFIPQLLDLLDDPAVDVFFVDVKRDLKVTHGQGRSGSNAAAVQPRDTTATMSGKML